MKSKCLLLLAAIAGATSMSAENFIPCTTDGKEVARLKIDCEQVTIVYANGTEKAGVDEVEVRRVRKSTAVEDVKVSPEATAPHEWYTLDGKRLANEPTAPGIYLKREAKQFVKVIKH